LKIAIDHFTERYFYVISNTGLLFRGTDYSRVTLYLGMFTWFAYCDIFHIHELKQHQHTNTNTKTSVSSKKLYYNGI